MSGRIVDIDVNPEKPTEFLLGMLRVECGIQTIMEHRLHQLWILQKQ